MHCDLASKMHGVKCRQHAPACIVNLASETRGSKVQPACIVNLASEMHGLKMQAACPSMHCKFGFRDT